MSRAARELRAARGRRRGRGASAAALCERLGVPLAVERVALARQGNLQARRATPATRSPSGTAAGGDYAAGHTASDQAETVLYRLAVSPGRRALLGMAPRARAARAPAARASTREETRGLLPRARARVARGPVERAIRASRARACAHDCWRRCASWARRRSGRSRRPRAQLRDEAEVLDAAVDDGAGELGGGPAARPRAARAAARAARLVLRRLAERGRRRARRAREAERSWRSAGAAARVARPRRRPARGRRVRHAALHARAATPRRREPVELPVPGRVRFGDWEVAAARRRRAATSTLAARWVGALTVRAWREGDRMRPSGLGGTKTLQDLFTDRKVPRALRRTLPGGGGGRRDRLGAGRGGRRALPRASGTGGR